MSTRVLLHVGTPKTGTSYLQDVLFRNRRTLAAAGILYPADRFDAHFLAALDLMRLPWGGLEAEAVGAWDALAEQVRAHDGTAIISHEILATASRAQAGRALESLGHGDGTEVHVVALRARPGPPDPRGVAGERQAPARADLRRVPRPDPGPARESRIATWFWGVQELPDILDRWGHDLPPERDPRGHGPAARAARRTCCGSGSASPSASTASTSTSRPSAPTRRSARPRPR